MSKPTGQKMCVINPAVVRLIAPLVGSQSEIMVRVGISWNSWNKLQEGLPIRCSMAERFRDRILKLAAHDAAFVAAYPSSEGGLNEAALSKIFILTAPEPMISDAQPRVEQRAAEPVEKLLMMA